MLSGDGPHQAPLACVLWVEVIIFMRHYACLVYPRATPNCVSLAIKGFIRHAESPTASSRGKSRIPLEVYQPPRAICCPFRGYAERLAPEKRTESFSFKRGWKLGVGSANEAPGVFLDSLSCLVVS